VEIAGDCVRPSVAGMMIVERNPNVPLFREQEETCINTVDSDTIRAIIEDRFRRMNYWPNVALDPHLFNRLPACGIPHKLPFVNSSAGQPHLPFGGSIHPFDEQNAPFRNDGDVYTSYWDV
jgi:hypothetical protein